MNLSLRKVLARYPLTSQPIGPIEPLGNAGGFSGASLWRFESPRGRLVLRRWPEPRPDVSQIQQIHSWLTEARDLGFLAVPIATADGATIIEESGRLWEIAPWLPGRADLRRPPALEHLRPMFTGLAALHTRLSHHRSTGSSPGLVARVVELDQLRSSEFASLRVAIERNAGDPASALAKTWIERIVPQVPRSIASIRQAAARVLPLQPCLRDVRPDHFLVEMNRLTGLVDFGAMGRDSVSGDLARLLGESVGTDRLVRAEALRAYESIRPLTQLEARSIEVFERANALLGPARWVRWHFVESRNFDDPDAVVRGLRRGLERLDQVGF